MKNLLITTSLVLSFVLPAFADQGEWRGRDGRGHSDRRDRDRDYGRNPYDRERDREIERRERWQKREEARKRQEMLDRLDRSMAETNALLEKMRREKEQREQIENMGRLAYFMDVTRRSGGEWLRVQLAAPAFLNYIQVMPITSHVRIHEAYIITSSRRKIALNEFAGRTLASPGPYMSDYIRAGEKIIAIDFRAESMGGSSNLFVTVTSSNNASLPEVRGVKPF